jgi:hypothetical protein
LAGKGSPDGRTQFFYIIKIVHVSRSFSRHLNHFKIDLNNKQSMVMNN